MSSPLTLLSRRVGDVMGPCAPIVDETLSCAVVTDRMNDSVSGSVLISNSAGELRGIVTEHDVARRMAYRTEPDAPIGDVMTCPVRTISSEDFLYRAVGEMRRHNLRHMPVVDLMGRPVGMLSLRNALAEATSGIVDQIDRLTHDATESGIAAVKAAQIEVAAALIEGSVAASDIQALLTDINKDLYRRVIDRALADMAGEGLGAPPVPFTAIVMGSGGRGENYLYPDQDNGFIIADYPDRDHTEIDGFFIELAGRMTASLDAIGFPFCKGGVMATNPVWRKTVSQWRAQTEIWARRRSVTTVRLADIFFDFQPVYGDTALAVGLRRHLTALMRRNFPFLQEINSDQSSYGTALGLFGRLRLDREPGPTRGQVNIKHGGLLQLVNAVRILSLRDGIAVTPTLARIAALRELGTFSRDDADDIAAAFRHMSDLVLRRQIECQVAREPVGYGVPLQWMSRREKKTLVDGLRVIEKLRDRVHSDLTGEIF